MGNVIWGNSLPPAGSGFQGDFKPGKPTQNAQIERFNKTYRTEVLGGHLVESRQGARDMTADGLHRYNHHHSHEALGPIPPVVYRVNRFPHLCF